MAAVPGISLYRRHTVNERQQKLKSSLSASFLNGKDYKTLKDESFTLLCK